MGQKLSRGPRAPVLPLHNNEANKNDGLNWKRLGGLGMTIIALSGFFISAMDSQGTWSSGDPEITVARYAASSNVTAGNLDAVHSAPSASRSKNSWTITEVVGLVAVVVLVPAMTMWYNHHLYGKTTKDRKTENKEKEEVKGKRRVKKEEKRRVEKATESWERKKLERRQELAANRRNKRLIQQLQLQWYNTDLSVKKESEIHYHTRGHDRVVQDYNLREPAKQEVDSASASESKACV